MTTDKISRRTLGGLAAAGVGVPLLAACGGGGPPTAADSLRHVARRVRPPSGGDRCPDLGHPGRRRRDLPGPEGRRHPADRGRLQVLLRDLHPPGLPGVRASTDGTINCACHGSKFSIEDGDVEQRPRDVRRSPR